MKRRTEQAYVLNAYKRLRQRGVPSIWEAPVLGRSIDLVYLENDSVITIEFKLNDWRRGLKQAMDHQIGGDFAYVCIIDRKPSEVLCNEAQKMGIGVLRFSDNGTWPFEVIQAAERSQRTWKSIREILRAKLKTRKKSVYANT